jgi:hypothetical protein
LQCNDSTAIGPQQVCRESPGANGLCQVAVSARKFVNRLIGIFHGEKAQFIPNGEARDRLRCPRCGSRNTSPLLVADETRCYPAASES